MASYDKDLFQPYILRGGLKRAAGKLKTAPELTVAFIGGSVTAGAGASDAGLTSYRALTCQLLQRSFPDVSFRFINAAVGGTDSTYGAFRLEEHVLKRGKIDLLFVEFAVNDNGDRVRSIRAMEGIVRHARRVGPDTDICFIYCANLPGGEHFARTGLPQANVIHHEEVAAYYGLPSIHIAGDVYRKIAAGELRWSELSEDDVHPNDAGYKLYAQAVASFLEHALSETAAAADAPRPLPPPLDPHCLANGRLLPATAAIAAEAERFRFVPEWTAERTCNWSPPAPVLFADEPGARLRIRFTGTAAGIVVLAGMDTGDIDVSVDEGPYATEALFDSHCAKFYRPKPVLLTGRLARGPHTLDLLLTGRRHNDSAGHALHITHLLINESGKERENDTI